MTLGEKLSKLRRENNITQEQLAERLGVSRQAISKWESDVSYPETDKLIQLGKLYNCSMDYLLKDEIEDEKSEPPRKKKFSRLSDIYFEKKSEKMVGKLPLWHINIGLGRSAKGVFAVGLAARGIVSLGFLSFGLVSCGMLSAGGISLGLLTVGLAAIGLFALGLLAAGTIAVGIVAFGAMSFGILSFGAMSVGQFAVGAMAKGHYFAQGDSAKALIAVGETEVDGSLYQVLGKVTEAEKEYIVELLYENVPKVFHWIIGIVKGVM